MKVSAMEPMQAKLDLDEPQVPESIAKSSLATPEIEPEQKMGSSTDGDPSEDGFLRLVEYLEKESQKKKKREQKKARSKKECGLENYYSVLDFEDNREMLGQGLRKAA